MLRKASVGGSYVASAANEAAVAALVKNGFTRAQAEEVIANARVTPEEVAAKAKAYVDTPENRALVADLMTQVGLTEAEAKRVIASGRDPQALIETARSVVSGALNQKAVDLLVGQGIPLAQAQALVATGGDPDKLLKLATDRKQLEALLKVVDARLKENGIDLGKRVAEGLGLDPKTLGAVQSSLQSAAKLYDAIDTLVASYDEKSYIASRWDASTVQSDESFASLARALQDMADQNADMRAAREAAYINAGIALAGTTAAIVPPPYGVAAGAAIAVVTYGLDALGLFDAKGKSDSNDPKYQTEAQASAFRIWKDWLIVPPTFDGRYWTLEAYRDANNAIYSWLQYTDVSEGTPWRARFEQLLYDALHPPAAPEGKKPPVDAAVTDLILLGWIPFSFGDWAGGENFVAGSHWNVGPQNFGGFGGAADLPPELWVGGSGGRKTPGAWEYSPIFNMRAATPEAMEGFESVIAMTPWMWGPSTMPGPFVSYYAPRTLEVQQLICDRIAAAIGTLVAVREKVHVEPVVLAAVAANRKAVEMYGWRPSRAAHRLRDTFLGAEKAARPETVLTIAPEAVVAVRNAIKNIQF